MQLGKPDQIDGSRIGHYEVGPIFHYRFFYVKADHRMGLGGVRAYHEYAAGVLELINRVSHGTTSECPCKACNS